MPVEQFEGVDRPEQFDRERVAARRPLTDRDDLLPRRREQYLAPAQLAGRAHERLPRAACTVGRLEQQHLGRAAGAAGETEAGRDHLRLVDDEQVAGAEDLGEVMHRAVVGLRRPPIDQQSRRVPRFDGHLGDAIGGQVVVELLQPHAATRYGSRSPGQMDAAGVPGFRS